MILILLVSFFFIFVINIFPVFMPPTWTVISLIGFNLDLNHYLLIVFSVLAAIASTSGRFVLSLFAKRIIRGRFLSVRILNSIDFLKRRIEKNKNIATTFFLLFSFSPLPSGALFLAYGLTGLKLRIATVPFFVGRLVIYLFWIFSASEVADRVSLTAVESGKFFSVFFVLTQIVLVFFVYLFTRIDWEILITKHKIILIK
jgi:membrane protein YqaA with SNARE-associated domain